MGWRHFDRNTPFQNIGRLQRAYFHAVDPVISMDIKKPVT